MQKQLPAKKKHKEKNQEIINKTNDKKWHVENAASKRATLANKQNYIL